MFSFLGSSDGRRALAKFYSAGGGRVYDKGPFVHTRGESESRVVESDVENPLRKLRCVSLRCTLPRGRGELKTRSGGCRPESALKKRARRPIYPRAEERPKAPTTDPIATPLRGGRAPKGPAFCFLNHDTTAKGKIRMALCPRQPKTGRTEIEAVGDRSITLC